METNKEYLLKSQYYLFYVITLHRSLGKTVIKFEVSACLTYLYKNLITCDKYIPLCNVLEKKNALNWLGLYVVLKCVQIGWVLCGVSKLLIFHNNYVKSVIFFFFFVTLQTNKRIKRT